MRKKAAALLITISSVNAVSNTEAIGDVLQIAIPAAGLATAFYLDDKEGQMQFYKSAGTNLAVCYTLKYTVNEKRPDSENTDSFPSSHTSSAFQGAAFIHKRYGWGYAVVPYLAAAYTGYSRVHENRHFWGDVLAGAAIGTASSWYFTTPYKKVAVTPVVSADYYGVNLAYRY